MKEKLIKIKFALFFYGLFFIHKIKRIFASFNVYLLYIIYYVRRNIRDVKDVRAINSNFVGVGKEIDLIYVNFYIFFYDCFLFI